MGTVVSIVVAHRIRPADLAVIHLNYDKGDGINYGADIRFDFNPLWEFGRDTDSTAFDLLLLSVIVYNVDRMLNRVIHSSDGWKREITLEGVPARNAATMNGAAHLFESSISFLTGDKWTIRFVQHGSWEYRPQTNRQYDRNQYTKVALFSGGLDSLIGFVDETYTLNESERILLISHVEQGKEGTDQNGIISYCEDHHIYDGRYDRIMSRVSLSRSANVDREASESTFRSRSLLFFAMGIYCAHSIDNGMQLIVPENGTISINIPLNPSRRSACSTRTTHPVFMKRLGEAMHAIGINNTLYNPYRLMSKADMMVECCRTHEKENIIKQLLGLSCSCAKRSHNYHWDKSSAIIKERHINHCGMCLPCIYRRVALDAINLDNPDYLGTNINNGNSYNIDDLMQKRARDYRSLLFFIRNRFNENYIRKELKANHITSEMGLEDYVNLAMQSYRQVAAWVAKNGSPRIKQIAGVQ